MSQTAAELMVDTLCDWGVEVVFGLPGDGITEFGDVKSEVRSSREERRSQQVSSFR